MRLPAVREYFSAFSNTSILRMNIIGLLWTPFQHFLSSFLQNFNVCVFHSYSSKIITLGKMSPASKAAGSIFDFSSGTIHYWNHDSTRCRLPCWMTRQAAYWINICCRQFANAKAFILWVFSCGRVQLWRQRLCCCTRLPAIFVRTFFGEIKPSWRDVSSVQNGFDGSQYFTGVLRHFLMFTTPWGWKLPSYDP